MSVNVTQLHIKHNIDVSRIHFILRGKNIYFWGTNGACEHEAATYLP